MESVIQRLDALESQNMESVIQRLDALEKENLSLRKELSHLKKVMKRNGSKNVKDLDGRGSDLDGDALKTTDLLLKELDRVKTIQKVFNRMIVNGHKHELEENIKGSDVPGMQVSIVQTTGDGDKMVLDVEPSFSVSRVKSLIEHKTGVRPCFQTLEFGDTKLVDEDKTLEDFGILDCSVISLSVEKGMQVSIVQTTGEGNKMVLDVEPFFNVSHVKSLIEHKIDVRPCHQILKFRDKRLEDEDKTLKQLGIQDCSVISLSVKQSEWDILIKVKGGKERKVSVGIRTTVLETMCIIDKQMEIPMYTQKALVFNGLDLEEEKLLLEYGIKHDSIVDLVLQETKGGDRIKIFANSEVWDVSHSMSVLEVKRLLAPESRSKRHELKFQDTILDNDKLLSHYDITQFSQLSSSTPQVDLWNCVGDVKRLVQDEKSVPIHAQTLVVSQLRAKCGTDYGVEDSRSIYFNPCILFEDDTSISSILLDPRITSGVQKTFDEHYSESDLHQTEINKEFYLPYPESATPYAKCKSGCTRGSSLQLQGKSRYRCKRQIHVNEIELFLLI